MYFLKIKPGVKALILKSVVIYRKAGWRSRFKILKGCITGIGTQESGVAGVAEYESEALSENPGRAPEFLVGRGSVRARQSAPSRLRRSFALPRFFP
jgi:hypothetical protein